MRTVRESSGWRMPSALAAVVPRALAAGVAALAGLWAIAVPVTSASARTWRVEKDGSGDFTAIQPAIDAAAPGDTIQIGPGRYTENAPFSPQPDGWVEPTYVGVTRENLTIRGTDRDAVIIGPTTPNFVGFGPKGIATRTAVQRLRVENLTVENVHDGMYLGPDELVVVSGCLLRGCDLGIFGVDDVRPLIDRCEFVRCREGVGLWTAHDGVVVDCTFTDSSAGVTYLSSSNGTVRDCTFTGAIGGVSYQSSEGLVEGCTFTNGSNFAIAAIEPSSTVTANDNSSQGGATGLVAVSGARISGTGNVIQATTYAAIRMITRATCSLHFNDILPAAGYAARAEGYLSGAYSLDVTNNYWGVDTAAEIAARIYDGNDDPTIFAHFQFEPFATQSVPAAQTSFGGLKRLFRGKER